MRFCLPLLLAYCLCVVTVAPSSAHPPDQEATPTVHTSRTSPQVLPLPKEDDVFHFVIFGDRTGGPAEGIKVLEQAVEDTNLLDPDLVMTVGDLVQGYNTTPDWLKQMKEFKGVMGKLKMPWFPVAGNHDVYWRGKNKPPGEHESNYETHFGPLWYWFQHKNIGFVVLYTDEGDTKTGEKGYSRPSQVQMSKEQLDWLEKSLAKLAGLEHVFVFLHHPRWVEQWYGGSNWPSVHRLLAGAGNVRAVFAGHIHRMRYDGKKDGIEYFSLATTGGANPGTYPKVGYLHHMNIVTVRKSGFSVAAIPVGAVLDPRQFTALRQTDIDLLRRLSPKREDGPIEIGLEGESAGYYRVSVTNPASNPIEIDATPEAVSEGWMFFPSHRHLTLKPGEKKSLEFAVVRKGSLDSGFRAPQLDLTIDYLEAKSRIRVPPRKVTMDVSLRKLPTEFFETTTNGILAVNGKNDTLRVTSAGLKLPQGPFTIEAWVNAKSFADSQAVLAKTEQSEFALFLDKGRPHFDVFLGDRYVHARANEALKPGQWYHLAGVYDGKVVSLYIDGKLVAHTPGSGPRKTNSLPLYIGADPDSRGNPTRFFNGKLDEVRISRGARYIGKSFDPDARHVPDTATALLLHCDKHVGPFAVDHSSAGAHALRRGATKIVAEERTQP